MLPFRLAHTLRFSLLKQKGTTSTAVSLVVPPGYTAAVSLLNRVGFSNFSLGVNIYKMQQS